MALPWYLGDLAHFHIVCMGQAHPHSDPNLGGRLYDPPWYTAKWTDDMRSFLTHLPILWEAAARRFIIFFCHPGKTWDFRV